MLNEIIQIDLHIHSCFSEYKDGAIVKDSTIENLDVLIKKLEENNISLCSITDHNRFDYKLYKTLKRKIEEKKSILKNNLPGIEFDVELETGRPKCHIIAIFDDSDEEKIKVIESKMFEIKKIEKPNGCYLLNEFENVLKNIGINAILIVHQKQGFENDSKKSNSLSDATSSPSKFMQVGFVDCLEYNFPRTEGIVKSSLRKVGLSFPIITGSDCHEWESYPYHDANSKQLPRDFTKFKCLPTFKGLLLSITSFGTRVNRINNDNKHYIEYISVNGVKYPLSNGINAIIGDNGSGKSLLGDVLASDINKYYKKIISENDIKLEYNDSSFQKSNVKYIKQGSIVEKVREGNLFDDNPKYFTNIANNNLFSTQITNYFNDVFVYVSKNIINNDMFDKLSKESLKIIPIGRNFYYPVIKKDIQTEEINEDKKRFEELKNIITSLKREIEDNADYYKKNKVYLALKEGAEKLNNSKEIIYNNYICKEKNNKVRAIIKIALENMELILKNKSNSQEIKKRSIVKLYDNFRKNIIDCIKANGTDNKFPKFPPSIDGLSTNEYGGYKFCKTSKYHQIDLKEEFYNYCFNKGFKNEEAIKKIKTKDEFSNALSNYDFSQVEEFKKTKLRSFIEERSKETTTISEISSNSKLGNTPGEISLVFYKFIVQEVDDEFNVLILDQPEDDINPKRIKEYLNRYLSSIKDNKQIILITHNPLLVVNLDVDNVIYLEKTNDRIEVRSGSLEYENNEYSILDLVKDNLDGGYEAIERRLKVYGKDIY